MLDGWTGTQRGKNKNNVVTRRRRRRRHNGGKKKKRFGFNALPFVRFYAVRRGKKIGFDPLSAVNKKAGLWSGEQNR